MGWLGFDGKGKGETYNILFGGLYTVYSISRTFARGRYSLIVSDL